MRVKHTARFEKPFKAEQRGEFRSRQKAAMSTTETFMLHGKDPQAWLELSKERRLVAELVLQRFWEVFRLHPSDARRVEQLAYMKNYMMLQALAFENLAKAILMTNDRSVVTKETLKKWEKGLGGHDIRRMVGSIAGNLSPKENDLLTRLEEYVRWAGRYPIPRTSHAYHKASEQNRLRFHSTDPELASELYDRLVPLVGTYEPWNESE